VSGLQATSSAGPARAGPFKTSPQDLFGGRTGELCEPPAFPPGLKRHYL